MIDVCRISSEKDHLQNFSTFLVIALVTIAWASTTSQSYAYYVITRNVFVAIYLAVLAVLIVARPLALHSIIIACVGLSSLGIYSWLNYQISAPRDDSNTFLLHIIWISLSSAVAANFFLVPRNLPLISDAVATMFIYFALVVAVITVLLGGLQIQGVPRFVFDAVSIDGTQIITYSQGLSKFYGLAAVFSALLYSRLRISKLSKLIRFGNLILFLILSLIGGGRGDFIASFVLCIVAIGIKRSLLFTGIVGVVGIVMDRQITSVLQNYTNLVDRYYVGMETFGMRDVLLAKCIELLINEPICLFFGGGIGFFQYYFGYHPGMYPHNVPVEFLISFGLVFTLPLIYFVSRGLVQIYRLEGFESQFLFVFAYFLLVGLKSGSVITSYLLVGCMTFLCMRGWIKAGTITGRQEILQ